MNSDCRVGGSGFPRHFLILSLEPLFKQSNVCSAFQADSAFIMETVKGHANE